MPKSERPTVADLIETVTQLRGAVILHIHRTHCDASLSQCKNKACRLAARAYDEACTIAERVNAEE